MTKVLLKEKALASLVHILISVALISVLAYLMYTRWYPSVLFFIDGGWEGIKIIIWVDVVLGPLLTFVVFNRLKKELKRDLSIIGFLQIGCLLAGAYVIYIERPLAITLGGGEFRTINMGGYEYFEVSPDYLEEISGEYPKHLFVRLEEFSGVEDRIQRLNVVPERFRRAFVRDMKEASQEAFKSGLNATDLTKLLPAKKDEIEKLWNSRSTDNTRFYSIAGRYYSGYVLYDSERQYFERRYLSPE